MVVVFVGGRVIAWKATDASLDDTADGIFGVRADVCAVLVFVLVPVNLLEEQQQHRGLDLR